MGRDLHIDDTDHAPLAGILTGYLQVTRWAESPGGDPKSPAPSLETLRRRELARRLLAEMGEEARRAA